jgi:integrase
MSVRKRTWVTRKGETKEAWIADFTDGTGKRHIQTFKHKKKADDYEARVKVAVGAGTHVAFDNTITITDAAESWIKRVEANGMRGEGGAERATVRQYRQHINLHIVPRIGKLKLAKLTKKGMEHFRDGLLEGAGEHKALSRPLARKVLTSVKSLLKAAGCGHVATDVIIGAKKREERKLEAGRDIPTPDEIKRLLATAKEGRQRALLLTAIFTGLRASELRGLRWVDIDFKAGELHVRQRADRFNNMGAPKTSESRRSIPLAPDLLMTLKEWKLQCPKEGDLDLVFPTSTGAIEHHKNMLRSLGPVMRGAGVITKAGKPKYALHAFRHFFASWCINPKERGGRELPPKVVQALLGHSSIVMTLDRYGHLFPRGDDRAELAAAARALLA